MKIILGADHGGFELKEKIKSWLLDKEFEVSDVGADSLIAEDDFVDYAKQAVKCRGIDSKIILICRNGYGMSIAANRFTEIRCGLAFDEMAVTKGRTDDDINCLSVPADYIDEEKAKKMIDIFLNEKFSGETKYLRRINKLDIVNL